MSSPGKFKRSIILNFSTVKNILVKHIMIYLLKPSLSVDYNSSENIVQLQILPTVMEGEAFIFSLSNIRCSTAPWNLYSKILFT